MERLKRKNRTIEDFGLKSQGGLEDLFDNAIKSAYRINDEEYDFICENATDEDLDFLLNEKPNISEKIMIMRVLNKYLIEFEKLENEE
jgi:hypothetical protein